MRSTLKTVLSTAVLLAVTGMLSNCSKTAAPAAATPAFTDFASGVVAVQNAMTKTSPRLTTDSAPTAMMFFPNLLKKLRGAFLPEAQASSSASLQAIWTTAGLMGNLFSNSAPALTPHDWMEQATDTAFTDSNGSSSTVFGKFFLGTALVCAMGSTASGSDIDTDGLFKVGTYTKTLDLTAGGTAATKCNIPAAMLSGAGGAFSVTITVTATTNQTYYTKLYELNDGSGDPVQPLYVKLDSANGIFHMMTVENYGNSSQSKVPDRTVAYIDGTVTKYEFFGPNFNMGETAETSWRMFRIYTDTAADAGYLLSSSGSLSGATITAQETFTMAAKPSTSGTSTGSVALSLVFQGETVTSPVDETANNDACISRAGAILTDATLSCDLTGTEASAAAAAIAASNAAHTSYTSITSGEAVTLSFTNASDIYTATITN